MQFRQMEVIFLPLEKNLRGVLFTFVLTDAIRCMHLELVEN